MLKLKPLHLHEIYEFLGDKFKVDKPCYACDSAAGWELMINEGESSFLQLISEKSLFEGNFTASSFCVGVIPLSCKNCGNMILFSRYTIAAHIASKRREGRNE